MVRNFLFHRVSPVRDKLWDPMDPALFEKCLKYISGRFNIIQVEDLISLDDHKKNFATISFDDGYKDNIEYAAPLLDKYKIKASFYVVTESIDRNVPTWTYSLEYLLQHTSKHSLQLPFGFLPPEFRSPVLQSEENRRKFIRSFKVLMKKLKHSQRTAVLDHITATLNDVRLPETMMSWDDIRELSTRGHQIGSHTVTHCMLGTMENEKEISSELEDSAAVIKKYIGRFPLTISYPVGSYDQETVRLSQAAGYQLGLAVKQTIYQPDKDNIFEIPRIELYNEPWWKTRMRITNSLENIKTMIGYR